MRIPVASCESWSENCGGAIECGTPRTALGAVVFVAEILAQERHVDDAAPGQIVVIRGGREGNGIVVGPRTY